jgi:Protein of unknown function (DUF3429)
MFDDPHLVMKERMAKRLGYAGFAPFALLAVWLLLISPGDAAWTGVLNALRAYAIAILSFVAGVRWGSALSADGTPRTLLISVIPCLIGWTTVFLSPVLALAILAMTFAAQGAWDVIATQNTDLPAWYGEIRMKITVLVVGALLAAIIAHGWSA